MANVYTASGRGPGVTEIRTAELDEGRHLTLPPPLIYVLFMGFLKNETNEY